MTSQSTFKSLMLATVILFVSIALFSSCNIVPVSNLRTFEITYFGKDTFVSKAAQRAGTYYVDSKVITQNIDDFLKKAGIDKSKVTTARLDSAIVTIPQSANLLFEDLEKGTFTIQGLSKIEGNLDSLSVVFPDTKGKVARLYPTSTDNYDVTKIISNAQKLTLGASLTTKKATPRSDIYLQYSFTIGYKLPVIQ